MNEEDKMLWMGDLTDEMDQTFIVEAFRQMGEAVTNVKTVPDKSGQHTLYGFVEFEDKDTARRVMLNINGESIPNARARDPPYKFNLSYANSPAVSQTEYNLFVNNLPSEVDDAALYKIFGAKYISCRGGKVYRDHEGRSKNAGFVRFADQTDQQRALVEMNKYNVDGCQITLKLAQPKHRGPRNQITIGDQTLQRANQQPVVNYFGGGQVMHGQAGFAEVQQMPATYIYAQPPPQLAPPGAPQGQMMYAQPPPEHMIQQGPPMTTYQQQQKNNYRSYVETRRERDRDDHRSTRSRRSPDRHREREEDRERRSDRDRRRRGDSRDDRRDREDRDSSRSSRSRRDERPQENLDDYIEAMFYDSDQETIQKTPIELHYMGNISGDKLTLNRRFIMFGESMLRAVDSVYHNQTLNTAAQSYQDIFPGAYMVPENIDDSDVIAEEDLMNGTDEK